ncbi:DUF3560 domain-containing protein [Streptomyces sp. HPF1205]|uniref:DUF3560 domain-containing protein n=1 Tax=Streptomyces sp. HPF1205 TaxID=2873262 RepID=UPI001CECA190|nr:DUF3560 domain-containing protein [Streptomyces sp. HPF1205]
MADITITHTRAEGTLLDGSSKGDGVYQLVAPHGFRYSRSIGIYLRHSRDKRADTWRIGRAQAALEAAGHAVTLDIDETTRRSFAEAEAERYERADRRAEWYNDAAGRKQASSDAKWETGRRIGHVLQGEPIKIGHHSEGRHRRDLERMHRLDGQAIAEQKTADYFQRRAEAPAAYEKHRKDPRVTLRRLERLGARRRDVERQLERTVDAAVRAAERGEPVPPEALVDRLARLDFDHLDLCDEIAHWQDLVAKAKAEGVKLWGPQDFVPGDFVLYIGSWLEVRRVNPKSLSVAWNLRRSSPVVTLEDATQGGRVGTHTADYTQVGGRCPGEAMRAFLAEGKVPGAKAARQAAEAAPAESIRQALAAVPKTKRHSDPKTPKRVRVECQWDATEAVVIWLDGCGRPHPGYEPETVTAPDGRKFTESVWSEALLTAVTELLAARGHAFRSGWTGSPGRGITCPIQPAPQDPPAPEPGGQSGLFSEQH